MKTVIFTVITVVIMLGCSNDDPVYFQETMKSPNVEKATFSSPTTITNKYYGPAAGVIYVYEGGEVGMNPLEAIKIERRITTKVIMGITCIIQHDIVYLKEVLVEDTDDWLAQDDEGNLWYFGEFVKNYDDAGNFIDNSGSWEYGVSGALPGYWMPANPTLGKSYYQEYYKGYAEDKAKVIAVDETVTIDLGTYENCIVTKDFTRFEPNVYEKKYYAPGIGLIKEESFEAGELTEVVVLTHIIKQN